MEPVFQRLYSYIFDTDSAGISAVEMDRQVPSAIFVVNFDKVWPASDQNCLFLFVLKLVI